MSERSDPNRIEVGENIYGVAFSTNGEYLLSGGDKGVQAWRVEDGQPIATMKTRHIQCLAVSKNGGRIAAGTMWGDLFVWDALTYKQVFSRKVSGDINGVDFSPDSSRLVAASDSNTASIWEITTREQVHTLPHENSVRAARYSLRGDRIATATPNSVRVYDSNNGSLLVEIKAEMTSRYGTGLLWFNSDLLVISNGKITQLDVSTGSLLSAWPVTDTDDSSCIALPRHGGFIAYSINRTVSFWDTSTRASLGLIQHPQDISSISISPDDQFIAVGGKEGKIIIESLSHVNASSSNQGRQDEQLSTPSGHDINSTHESGKLQGVPPTVDSISSPHLDPTFQEPGFPIDGAILDLWKQDQLKNAEVLLTAAITTPQNITYHTLASRALVRVRMGEWDTALMDAERAIEIQPSITAYIAKSIALVGKGERQEGYRTCDIAFAPFHSSHVYFLLLVKAIIVFIAGEHPDAISRVDDLIATVPSDPVYYVVQAYMYLLVGDSCMETSDFKSAIESLERAKTQIQYHTSRALMMISLISGWKFDSLGETIRQRLCEALYAVGRTKDAVKCFLDMVGESGNETNPGGEHLEWALDFRQRSSRKLEHLGDAAADAQQYEEAISLYTTALSLDPSPLQDILIKRSKAHLAIGSWKQALDDASQVITLDASSPRGYEMKHAALHKAGDYNKAIDVFEVMLAKIEQSPDPAIRQRRDQYITPSKTRSRIRRIVQLTLRDSPHVLIDTTTGHLRNRTERASAFASSSIFNELVSCMTTRIDRTRIKSEVKQYFQYVMLSHKWEDNEPLFREVAHIAVYDLDLSPTHDKLQMFCKIVRDAGFKWAWSDTCCIDTGNRDVHQEALVAMFKWYRGSALMIVFLRGVHSSSESGALAGSIWNTRGWTLQEYIAAKVIYFYTEDWTPYLNLELRNHKESSEVISEMEQATGVSSQQLMALRPGLTSIREKLRLASTRQTERVEDAAYSLLGILSVTGIPPIYGEGEAALGRLLAHVLAGSGDLSILAWNGESGSFNSCLPAHISVFNGPATSHLPSPVLEADMERIIIGLRTSFDLDVALKLYERLSDLPPPWFAASRMKLPCIAFQLPLLSSHRTRSGRVYRVDTLTFGMVEIATRHDLSRMKTLYLLHPWLDSLLEQQDIQSGESAEGDVAPLPSPNRDDDEISDDELDDEEISDEDDPSPTSVPELPSHAVPVHAVPADKETLARRFVARLRQPFGALLVTSVATGRRTMDYRRVAADSSIMVQLRENVPLADILDNVRTLDIL